MPMFDFECFEPYISFGSHLNIGGKVDQFEWDGIDIFEHPPDLSGFEITWHLVSGRSVFEYYANCQADLGKKISDRIPNFAEYWKNATGSIHRFSERSIEITICHPPSSSFDCFISTVVASGQGLRVHGPRVSFADTESAPAPTVRAFMEDYEPAFFGNSEMGEWWGATFVPFRQKQPERSPAVVETSNAPMPASGTDSFWRSIFKATTN